MMPNLDALTPMLREHYPKHTVWVTRDPYRDGYLVSASPRSGRPVTVIRPIPRSAVERTLLGHEEEFGPVFDTVDAMIREIDAIRPVEPPTLSAQLGHLKHEPGGSGNAGPCDADCAKCKAERVGQVGPPEHRPARGPAPGSWEATLDAGLSLIDKHDNARRGNFDAAQESYAQLRAESDRYACELNAKIAREAHERIAAVNADRVRHIAMQYAQPGAGSSTFTTPWTKAPDMHGAAGDREYRTAKVDTSSPLYPEMQIKAPVDPLDVEYDGVKLRDLLEVNGGNVQLDSRWVGVIPLSPAQRAAVSAHWSAQLRAKVAASAERERNRVRVDLQDLEPEPW